MDKQRRNPSHQEEEEDSEDLDNPEAEIWYCKGKQVTEEPVAQNSEAWGTTRCHHGASSSIDKGSQKDTEATWNDHLQISRNTSHCMEAVPSPWSGKSMEDNLAILWKI